MSGCASGTHDHEQAQRWHGLGCDYAVGPLCGEVASAHEFPAVLDAYGPARTPHIRH